MLLQSHAHSLMLMLMHATIRLNRIAFVSEWYDARRTPMFVCLCVYILCLCLIWAEFLNFRFEFGKSKCRWFPMLLCHSLGCLYCGIETNSLHDSHFQLLCIFEMYVCACVQLFELLLSFMGLFIEVMVDCYSKCLVIMRLLLLLLLVLLLFDTGFYFRLFAFLNYGKKNKKLLSSFCIRISVFLSSCSFVLSLNQKKNNNNNSIIVELYLLALLCRCFIAFFCVINTNLA